MEKKKSNDSNSFSVPDNDLRPRTLFENFKCIDVSVGMIDGSILLLKQHTSSLVMFANVRIIIYVLV